MCIVYFSGNNPVDFLGGQKEMKKVLAFLLALVLVLSLTACGSKETLDGSWKLTSMTSNGKDVFAEEGFSLADFEANGILFGLTAKDGKLTMTLADESSTLEYDDKYIIDPTGNTEKTEYKINNGVLTMEGKEGDNTYTMSLKKMTDAEATKFANQTPNDITKAMYKMLGLDPEMIEKLGE